MHKESTRKENIYIIEDDVHIQQLLKYNLEASGYGTSLFENGEKALASIQDAAPDLILLDLMLPGKDGMEICRVLKTDSVTKDIPIIMLTAKSEEFDKVLGLEMGADDYVTKPLSIRELIARIKAVMRRSSKEPSGDKLPDVIRIRELTINLSRHEVYKGTEPVDLTLKEFELLKLLAVNKGKVLTRDLLLERVWGYDYFGETRTVDVHIHYLRSKLEQGCNSPENTYIETVRGIGYRFNDRIPV